MATAQAVERLEARITSDQKDLFREAADVRGVTLTDFVVASVYEAAVRTLEESRLLKLSRRDQAVFVEALLKDEQPSERLRQAAERHGYVRTRR